MSPATAIAYIRVSTDGQDTERQRRGVTEHCARAGIDLLGIVEEPEARSGRSAAVKRSPAAALAYYAALASSDYARLERPGYRTLLQRVATEHPAYVLAYSLDRISRDATELDLLRRILESHGAAFLILNANGILDTTSASGKFMFRVFAAQAEMECDTIAERTRHKLRTAPRAGAARGNPGLGWRVHAGAILPDEPARDRMRQAHALKADGADRPTIAAALGISVRHVRNYLLTHDRLAAAAWPASQNGNPAPVSQTGNSGNLPPPPSAPLDDLG